MKISHLVLVVVLAAAAAFGGVTWAIKSAGGGGAKKETAFERVMRTNTLRCAYFIYPQLFERDPNTGALSGALYELGEEMGRQLGLKIAWQEVGLANVFEGLKAGRYDAVCSAIAYVPSRLRTVEYTSVYFYLPFFLYAREGDARFDNDFSKIDDPSVRVAYLEGEMGQYVKQNDFPRAQSLSLQNLTGFSDVPMQVATGKADVCMGEPAEMDAFMAKNPGKVRQIPGPPIRMQPIAYQVDIGEHDLRNLLDGTLFSLQVDGFIPKLLEKYFGKPGHYYFLPARAWRGE